MSTPRRRGGLLVAWAALACCHPVSLVDPCAVCPEGTRCEPGPPPRCLEADAGGDAEGEPADGADDGQAGDSGACPPEDLPYGGECDPVDQTCCPFGERCLVTRSSPEFCTDLAGSGLDGTACFEGGEADCVAGTSCVSGGFVSTCMSFCRAEEDCPAGRSYRCVRLTTGATEYAVCYPGEVACDPVAATGCRPGEACVLAAIDWSFPRTYTTCVPEGTNAPGESCRNNRGCRAGSGCYTDDGVSCVPYCLLDDPDCPERTACRWFGHARFGLCSAA